eukprot:Nk52_evm28s208 gene=Nk52_evmTU28s208
MPLHYLEKRYRLALITEDHKKINSQALAVIEKEEHDEKNARRPKTPPSLKLPEITNEFIAFYNSHYEDTNVQKIGERMLQQFECSAGLCKGSGKPPKPIKTCIGLYKLKDCSGVLGDKAMDLMRVVLELSPLHTDDIKGMYDLTSDLIECVIKESEEKYTLGKCGKKIHAVWLLLWKILGLHELKEVMAQVDLGDSGERLLRSLRTIYNIFDQFQDQPDELMKLRFMVECLRKFKQESSTIPSHSAFTESLRLIPHYFNGDEEQRQKRISEGAISIRDEYDPDSPGHTTSIFIWLENLEVMLVLAQAASEDINVLIEFQRVMTTKTRTCTWELIYLYTYMLTFIVLNTESSRIKKLALEGHSYGGVHQYGVIGFLSFKGGAEVEQSWKIRFGALKAVTSLWKCTTGGEQMVAWASLNHTKENETEDRVKIGITYGLFEADFFHHVQKYKKIGVVKCNGLSESFSLALFNELVVQPIRHEANVKGSVKGAVGKSPAEVKAIIMATTKQDVQERNERKREMLRIKWKKEQEDSDKDFMRYPSKDVVLKKKQESRRMKMKDMYGYIGAGNPRLKTHEVTGQPHDVKYDFGNVYTENISQSYQVVKPYYERIKGEMCDILNAQAERKRNTRPAEELEHFEDEYGFKTTSVLGKTRSGNHTKYLGHF